MSAVLKHLRKYRPEWHIDFVAEPGREKVGRGIAHNILTYGAPKPTPHYDLDVPILLFDTFPNFHDRPNTRVASCLHERFGLAWDADCGRYGVAISEEADCAAKDAMRTFVPGLYQRGKPVVAVHYRGDSSPAKKDLSDAQADEVCRHVIALGRTPLLLDWRNIHPRGMGVCTTGGAHFSREWGRDAEMNCAVIRHCEAFVGIDSGPSKCASATDTPALVTWTGHHPAPFHDPADNTTHLVPCGYHGLDPVCDDPGVIEWFEANHNVRVYDSDPVSEIKAWLSGVLC